MGGVLKQGVERGDCVVGVRRRSAVECLGLKVVAAHGPLTDNLTSLATFVGSSSSQRRSVKVIRAATACSLDEGAEGGCGDAVVEAESCGGWVNYGSARKESPSLFLHT